LRRGCVRCRIWKAGSLHPSSGLRGRHIYCTHKSSISWQLSSSGQR